MVASAGADAKRQFFGHRRGGVVALFALAAFAATVWFATGAGASGTAASKSQAFTVYSVTTAEQFVNNADDRQRGQGANPFGNYKDATATTAKSGKGPFPGDMAVFSFNLYANAVLGKRIGTATFTCQYNLNNHALCNASYVLKGGTMVGVGNLNFNERQFSLAITGGDGTYNVATGTMSAAPSKGQALRLSFVLS